MAHAIKTSADIISNLNHIWAAATTQIMARPAIVTKVIIGTINYLE